MARLYFIVTLFLLSLPAVAQKETFVPLDTLIAQALERNPGLLSLRTAVRGAEARIGQSTAWPDPQAAFTFHNTPSSTPNPFKAEEFDYSIQQMIPFPGKTNRAADVARAGVRMAGGSIAIRRRALIAQVKTAYGMLYAAQEQIDINRENQELLAGMITTLETAYAVSQATQADILKLRIELAKLRSEESRLLQEESVQTAMLNAMRGDSTHRSIGRIRAMEILPFPYDAQELIRRACLDCTELQKVKYEIEMLKAEKGMLERERLPDFMVGAMYKQMHDMPDRWDLMLGLNIPFAPWSSGKYSGRIEETTLKIRQMEEELAEMTNMVALTVHQAFVRARSRWEEIERYRNEILPQSEQALRSQTISYQTRKSDFLSLLDTFRMRKMYTMEYYMAVADYLANRAEIEKEIAAELE